MFQPAGDAVLCRCNHVIDMSRGQEVPVEAEPTVTVSGLRYNVRGEGGGGGGGEVGRRGGEVGRRDSPCCGTKKNNRECILFPAGGGIGRRLDAALPPTPHQPDALVARLVEKAIL